jgi:hypothetical protein
MKYTSGGFMSRFKSQTVLFFILVFALIILAITMIFKAMDLQFILNIKKTVYFSQEIDTNKAEFVNFLNTQTMKPFPIPEASYMEVVGGLSAKNHDPAMSDSIKEPLNKISRDYTFAVSLPQETVVYEGEVISQESTKAMGSPTPEIPELTSYIVWPTTSRKITSGFGLRSGFAKPHTGIDIGGDKMPVYAAADGLVVYTYSQCMHVTDCQDNPVPACDCNNKYGNYIAIKHMFDSSSYYSFYSHLGEVYVKKDQTVKRGDMIAKSDNTGYSTAPHLHFEFATDIGPGYVMRDAYAINPCPYLGNPPRCSLEVKQPVYAETKAKSDIYVSGEIPIPGAGKSGHVKTFVKLGGKK